MASWVKVGAKCECIDDRKKYWDDDEMYPVAGELYTIRTVSTDYEGTWVTLVEVKNTPRLYAEGFCEVSWNANRFRPLITKTQEHDIEMFLRIANDTPFHVMIDEETNA